MRYLLPLILLLVQLPAMAVDAPVGRLFFSPAERKQLDSQRLGIADGGNQILLGGVTRSAGKAVRVWLNGTSFPLGDTPWGKVMDSPKQGIVLQTTKGVSLKLKVGEAQELP